MGGARYGGVWIRSRNNKWLLPPGVRFKMRITYTATGEGRLQVGFLGYPADPKRSQSKKIDNQSRLLKLEKEPKTVERILMSGDYEYMCPIIAHSGSGTVEVTEFSLEPLPPEKQSNKK